MFKHSCRIRLKTGYGAARSVESGTERGHCSTRNAHPDTEVGYGATRNSESAGGRWYLRRGKVLYVPHAIRVLHLHYLGRLLYQRVCTELGYCSTIESVLRLDVVVPAGERLCRTTPSSLDAPVSYTHLRAHETEADL
eukprot:1510975-Rhodomonas_salina.1